VNVSQPWSETESARLKAPIRYPACESSMMALGHLVASPCSAVSGLPPSQNVLRPKGLGVEYYTLGGDVRYVLIYRSLPQRSSIFVPVLIFTPHPRTKVGLHCNHFLGVANAPAWRNTLSPNQYVIRQTLFGCERSCPMGGKAPLQYEHSAGRCCNVSWPSMPSLVLSR
jgi:hypothetical protein